MAAAEQREDARWEHLMESVDLLFAKVGVIDHNQQQLNTQMDLSAQVVERMLRDQEALAKQMELTGQAVARLTLDRHHTPPESPRPSTMILATGISSRVPVPLIKRYPLLTIIVTFTGITLSTTVTLAMHCLNCLFQCFMV